MTWQPIETAPAETAVILGKYSDGYGDEIVKWRTSVGIAWERKVSPWLGRVSYVRPSFQGEYTHWQPLPPPPGDGE